MRQRRRWWRRLTTRPDEGAAAVEFALLFPIFAILVMGMISAGIAFSKQINITQAARETSRFGATLTIQAAGGDVEDWLQKVSQAGQNAAGPDTDPIGGHEEICVSLVDTADSTNTVHMIDNVAPANPGHCPDATVNNALGPKYVQVTFRRSTNFFAVFLNKDLELWALSTTPYEPGTTP
jgi:Flp pilus assembly protein TadG